jgi:hypothetical protein
MSDDGLIPTAGSGGSEPSRPERIVYPEHPRFRRIRFLSTLMDQSIRLPTGYRIGIDPFLGLIPGIGDGLGAAVSCYLIYQAARLGLPKRILARMFGNVLIEAAAGTFPLIGDIFDAVWKANIRNFRLVELHYRPTMPERRLGTMAGWVALVFLVIFASHVAMIMITVKLVSALFWWVVNP